MAGASALSFVPAARPVSAQTLCDEITTLEAEIAAHQRRIMELHATSFAPRFPPETNDAARDAGRDARESVVLLDVGGSYSEGTATAWFVTDHYLLTNAHNVEDDFETLQGVTVRQETFEAELVGSVADQQPDVALLRTGVEGTPLPIGDAGSLTRGDPLVQVGYSGGFGHWVITLGSYLDRGSSDELSASIPGLEGNSGSPILDLDGQVVAMTFGAQSEGDPAIEPTDDEVRVGLLAGEPFTSAVPIDTAMEQMDEWT
jgi:serine protease Do